MANAAFIGLNTIDQYKKYTLTDFPLIKRDLLNALNIRQGEMPGRPDVGTTIWNYVFDAQTTDTMSAIENEIQRVIAGDPRLYVNALLVFPQDNGILIEIDCQLATGTDAQVLSVFFDQQAKRASYV